MELAQLTTRQIEDMEWYYSIELKQGAYTRERIFRGTVALVRDLIARSEVSGRRCLDIGTQEGIVAALLARNGGQTVAYDRLSLTERIALVQQAYQVEFEYLHGIQLPELREQLTSRGAPPFDLVVFAGVLYHMVNPLSGLALARSFLRQGGLMVLETAAVVSEEPIFAFNVEGQIYGGSNYFVPSLASLDYMCRLLRLRPIDCAFIKPNENNIGRVAVVCRAEDQPVAPNSDTWIRSQWVDSDLRAIGLDFGELDSTRPPVPYDVMNVDNLAVRPETGSVDLFQTVTRCVPHSNIRQRARLSLSDAN